MLPSYQYQSSTGRVAHLDLAAVEYLMELPVHELPKFLDKWALYGVLRPRVEKHAFIDVGLKLELNLEFYLEIVHDRLKA